MSVMGMLIMYWWVFVAAVVVIGCCQLAYIFGEEYVEELVDQVNTWFASWKAKRECRRYIRGRVRAATKKVSQKYYQLLSNLYIDEVEDDVADLIEKRAFTKAAVSLGQRARIELKFPKSSPANALVVADWLNRNAPASMGVRQRARIFPLAIKLAFVRSLHEHDADMLADWFKEQTDFAK